MSAWSPKAVEEFLEAPDYDCPICYVRVSSDRDLRHDAMRHAEIRQLAQARELLALARAEAQEAAQREGRIIWNVVPSTTRP